MKSSGNLTRKWSPSGKWADFSDDFHALFGYIWGKYRLSKKLCSNYRPKFAKWSISECLQKVNECFCSIYRPNIDQHFEKNVAIIDQNHKVSEKYEHGWNLAKINQENDLQAGEMSRFYGWFSCAVWIYFGEI